uniref:Deoxycytidylate deaminase n=1 Tax=Maylandia zebra TaxID=106582 RepID=A0A3P9BF45_9CICH
LAYVSCKSVTDFLVDTDYFMAVAVLSAQRSKDPNTQVGACLVNQDNKIVGTGHNCMPNDCEGKLPWNREGAKLDTKYIYVCHAELNAIVNASANADVKGCTMYVTLFPCNECTKLIIQAGLKEVVYLCDKYHKTPETKIFTGLMCLCLSVLFYPNCSFFLFFFATGLTKLFYLDQVTFPDIDTFLNGI